MRRTITIVTVTLVMVAATATVACAAPGGLSLEKRMAADTLGISASGPAEELASMEIQKTEDAYDANTPQLTPEQEWQDLEMLAQKFNVSISGMTIEEAKKAIQEAQDAYIASMLVQKTG